MFWLEEVLKHPITHPTKEWYQLISPPPPPPPPPLQQWSEGCGITTGIHFWAV